MLEEYNKLGTTSWISISITKSASDNVRYLHNGNKFKLISKRKMNMGNSIRNLPQVQWTWVSKLKLSAIEDFNTLTAYVKKYYKFLIGITMFLMSLNTTRWFLIMILSFFVILWYWLFIVTRNRSLKFVYKWIVSS